MPVTAICNQCHAAYKLPDNLLGKKVKCKRCDQVFSVVKPTMLAGEGSFREKNTTLASKPAAKKTQLANKSAPATKLQPRDDEAIVEAQAAQPRPAPLPPKKNERQARKREEEDRPRSRNRRAERGADYDDDRPRRRPARRDEDDDDRGRLQARPVVRRSEAVDDLDDADPDAGPKKSRRGLVIGLIAGSGVMIAAAVLILVLVMGGGRDEDGGEGPGGVKLVETPEVTLNLAKLREVHTQDEAIFFFANYEAPEKEAKRKEIATTLETVLRNRMGRSGEPLVRAYCKWAGADGLSVMIEMLEWRNFDHLGDPFVRDHVFAALGKLKDDKAAEATSRFVRTGDRNRALKALEAMGPSGEKQLAKFYFDGDGGLSGQVKDALRRMGAKESTFIDGGLAALKDRAHPSRNNAVDFFRDFRDPPVDRSIEVCSALVGFALERHPFTNMANVLKAAANWITKDSAPGAAERVLPLLGDRFGTRDAALTFLKSIPEPPADKTKIVCEKLMEVANDRFGYNAELLYGALEVWATKESIPAVAKMVQNADRIANLEQALKVLAKFKGEPGVAEAIAKRVQSVHARERDLAEKLLAELGPGAGTAPILAELNSPDFGARENARRMLAKLGVSDDLKVGQSVKDLGSGNDETRRLAAEYLTSSPVVEKHKDAAAKALNGLMFDANPSVRDHAINALAKWWNKSTLESLAKVATDPGNLFLRHRVIDIMAKTGDISVIPVIASRLLTGEDRFPARRALEAMGPVVEPEVQKYLIHMDRGVRGDALSILEKVGTKASLGPIMSAAKLYALMDKGFYSHAERVFKTLSVR